MVIQVATVASPTIIPTADRPSKLDLSPSIGVQSAPTIAPSTSSRWSQPKCISRRTYLPVCQPAMEATKALAQRLRHRASLRRASKQTTQTPAARKAPGKQQQQAAAQAPQAARPAANLEGDQEKQSATLAASPVTVAIPEPPVTVPANSTPSLTISSALDPPLTPSPGSDISPTSQQPPKLVRRDAPTQSTASEPPTTDYFALDYTTDTREASTGKTTTAASRTQGIEDKGQEQRPYLQEDSETAVSSVSPPSTVVSPRESVDDDAGRSSIVSFGGGWSRHSSMSSPLAFRMPDGSLPQGRTKTSHKSRHRDCSPNVTSK